MTKRIAALADAPKVAMDYGQLAEAAKLIEDAVTGFGKLPPLKRPFGEGLDEATTPKPGEQP